MPTLAQSAQGALITIFYIAGPILGIILVIGVLVGVFLAATQINEPTISFVPKFLGTAAVLAVLGPWLLRTLETYATAILSGLPRILQ